MNANSFAPKTEAEIKKQNWHRIDCLAKRYIEKFDKQSAVKWFESQNEEWQAARLDRFTSRLNERRW